MDASKSKHPNQVACNADKCPFTDHITSHYTTLHSHLIDENSEHDNVQQEGGGHCQPSDIVV